jgi:DNA-binding response OmpR family regulator
MEKKPTVLLVEDDAGVAAGVVRGLRADGFQVDLATDGLEGARKALTGSFDAIVLDLMLPEQSGIAILEQLQGRTSTPVLVLTAKTELSDRLRCFGLGAADFLTKPFWMEELIARLRARLRIPETAPRRRIEWADAVLDLDGRTVSLGSDQVSLTRHEFDLLAYLIERPGRAVSREQLAERTLSALEPPDPRTVDTHIARIRKKLGARAGLALTTVWGIGYRFDPPPGQSP